MMEVNTNPYVRLWLRSLGYPVHGQPRRMVDAMFKHEARQWKVTPEELEAMVLQDYGNNSTLTWKPLALIGAFTWKPLFSAGIT